jgi:hypothetical protein
VSSAGQQAIDFADVMLIRGYSGARAYCQSKLAQVMFTIDLADELAGTGVNIEYALARLGRRQVQQLLRQTGNRTIHSRALVGPRPRGGAIPKFDLRFVPRRGLMVCHCGPLGFSSRNFARLPAGSRPGSLL